MTRQSTSRRFRKRKVNVRKFIPDSDRAFAAMAWNFAHSIEQQPEQYMLCADDARVISEAVQEFRNALAANLRPLSKSKITRMRKDAAREKAEKVVRECAKLIRANDEISADDKMAIGITERKRPKRRECPKTPPFLRFVRGQGRMHVLEFLSELAGGTRAKPPGAKRLELFVGLVEPGEPIPARPDERSDSCGHFCGWYVRSFTKNPIEVEHPRAPDGKPMLVVWWGRWADSTGEVGPWSETVVARVEG